MMKLFDIQPKESRQKLYFNELLHCDLSENVKRIINFDPAYLYENINENDLMNSFTRQCSVSIKILFPDKKDGKCGCGCGNTAKKRWHSKQCRDFANSIFMIIGGYSQHIRNIRAKYIGGYKCEICGCNDSVENSLELDHIFPVAFGGGGGWISNYQFKCKKCHREKTNKDFGWKQ